MAERYYQDPQEQTIIPVGDELELRQLVHADAEVFFGEIDACRDHVGRFDNPTPIRFSSLESTHNIIDSQKYDLSIFGIWKGVSLVGGLSIAGLDSAKPGLTEVGYWVSERHVGNGYASRSLAAATDYALYDRGVPNIGAYIRVGNVASARTAQKGGLKYFGYIDDFDGQFWLFGNYQQVPTEIETIFKDDVVQAKTLRENTQESVAWIKLNGVNKAVINHGSDTTYTIDSGEATFIYDGQTEHLDAGDSITLLKGMAYQDVGRATMYALVQPPFDPGTIEYVSPQIASTTNLSNASV